MSIIKSTPTVILITDNVSLDQEIANTLTEKAGYSYIGNFSYRQGISKRIQVTNPNIVLIDCSSLENNLAIIDEITSSYTDGAVVAILPNNNIHLADRVILAGARAILLHPFSEQILVDTLNRIQELVDRTRNNGRQTHLEKECGIINRTIVVYSPKGGGGCSTLATNLAIAIHQLTKEDVIIVDGKKALGHVALMLNLRTANSVADLTVLSHKLDPELINQVVMKHISGISILPSPINISKGNEIHPDDLFRTVMALKNLYAYIIVDGGSYLDQNLITYMDSADQILVVVNANIASLRDTRQFIELSENLSYSKGKIKLILNEAGRKTGIKLNDIELSLRAQIFHSIPVDQDFSMACLNDGVPIILRKSNHPISRAILKIGKTLIKFMDEEMIAEKVDKADQIDILRKSSYYG